MLKGANQIVHRRFWKDLIEEIKNHNTSNGAAALAYYLMLAIFPAGIFVLSLLPFLPIPHLYDAIMDFLSQALPGQSASLFASTLREITSHKQGSLLSIGFLLTLWAASSGMYAVMQQLNMTYDVKEQRPFWKTRGIALGLTAAFGILMLVAFGLVVLGGQLQDWIGSAVGNSGILLTAFAVVRWVIIAVAMLLGLAVTYYFGPDVEQKFSFITPGSALGLVLLVAASLGFKFYADHFGKYNATYGSLGAVIVLMLWLNITGLVILVGSEINALIELYSPEGKSKGEKKEKTAA